MKVCDGYDLEDTNSARTMKSISRFIAVNLAILILALAALEFGLRVAGRFPDARGEKELAYAPVQLFDEKKIGEITHYSTRYTNLAHPERGELIPLSDGRFYKVLDSLPPAHFEMPKPAGVFRSFILGSSPIAGFGDISRLSELAKEKLPEDFELIDLAGRGSSALEVGIALDRVLKLAPDAVLVYPAGIAPDFGPEIRREDFSKSVKQVKALRFLRGLRVFRLLENFLGAQKAHAAPPPLTQPLPLNPNPPEKKYFPKPKEFAQSLHPREVRVQKNIKRELANTHERFYLEAAGKTHAAQAVFVFITPTTNQSDFWPLLSYHKEKMNEEELKNWLAAYTTGTVLQDEGDCAGALEMYAKALNLDDEYAALWYRRGQCLLETKRREEAMKSFHQALIRDAAPERFLARPMRLAKLLEELPGVVVLDTEAEFEKRIPGAVFGSDIFIDYDHFTPRAADALAAAVSELLIRIKGEAGG
jgi:Tetratricopeptide repeat